jgi:hypothetical protein
MIIKLIFYQIVIFCLLNYFNVHFLNLNYINLYQPYLINRYILYSIYGNYIKHFRNKNEIYIKTGLNIEKKNLVTYYIKNTLEFNSNDKKTLYFYIDIIRKKYNTYRLITHTRWNFIKISYKLEKSMPFTLNNYIFLSDRVLKNFYNSMINNKNLLKNCETLIHEKIHIIQRNNQKLFNTLYTNYLTSIYCNNLIITNYWNNKIMTNPDGLEIKWIYKFNNKYYLPLLVIDKEGLKERVITLRQYKNSFITTRESISIANFPLFNDYPSNISYYHPNEISAYIISRYIVNERTINKYQKKIIKYYLNVFK